MTAFWLMIYFGYDLYDFFFGTHGAANGRPISRPPGAAYEPMVFCFYFFVFYFFELIFGTTECADDLNLVHLGAKHREHGI